MAATAKQYELLFQLTARLGPNFSQSFKDASKVMTTLQSDLKGANQKLKDVSAYQKQQTAVQKSKERVGDLQAEHERLVQEIEATGEATPQLTRRLQENEKALQKAQNAAENEEERLQQLSNTLREAGIDTNNLDRETGELNSTYQRLEQTQKRVQEISEKQAANKQAISQTKGQLTGLVAGTVALGAAIYAGPVKSAMEFESNMSEVAKVVDWLKDDTGAVTKEYTALKNEILAITTQIPMTAEEISQIMAAAGQSNVAKNNAELVEFTKSAAKMGIAFDTTSDQAGEWMAKWRTSFGLTQEQVIELSDKINYLGNTSAANAMQISGIVTKIGPLGEVAGFASGEIAALGATLVSTGVNEDVAATGIKNLMLSMSAGTSITKRQSGVLKQLGVDSKELAKRMQTDAKGAVIDLLNAFKKLPEAQQAAALKDYFGKESIGAIAPLLTNLDYLEEQFNKVGDASLYAGSMEAEYAARADTTENKVQLAKNSLAALSTTIGDVFLPYVGQAAEALTKVINKFSEFAQKNPGVIKLVIAAGTALIGLKAAGLVGKLAFLEVKGGVLAMQKAFTMIKGLGITKWLGGVTGGFGGILKTMLPIVGVVAAIGGAIYYVSTHLEEVRGFIKKTFGEEGLAVFDKLWGIITEVGTAIKSAFFGSGTGILDTLKELLPTIINTLKTGLLPLLPMLMDTFTQIIPLLGNVITAILPVLGELLGAVITVLATLIAEILPILVELIATIIPIALQIITAILPVLVQLIQAIVPILLQIVQAVLPVLIQLIKAVVPVLIKIVQAILPVIIQLIETLLPVLMQIIQAVLPVFVNLLNTIVPIFMQIIQAILPVIIQLIETLIPIIMQIINTILPVIIQLVQMLLPIIMQIIDTVLPVFISLLNTLIPIFTNIIDAILPVLITLLQALMPVIQFVAEIFTNVLGTALTTVTNIISNVMQIFQGLIDFITGVFTGNWTQAWEGIKSIFSGIVGGLGEIIKAPLRVVISAVNTVIRGLNKLKVPDWVPGLGGKGINIPEIPGFMRGTNRTPNTFVAGEGGPELITNAEGRKVFTAAQTGQIFNNLSKAQNLNEASGVNASLGGGNTIVLQIQNTPTVVTQGSEDVSGIKAQLQQYDEEFLEKIRAIIVTILKEQKEQEGRVAYA